ncbi:MAG TPA: ABC transporter substrate-binding protein [Stellaceae bacterium]|nr:ABC transporter substrate-binding protein [Stellaceae bacterium]
MAARALAFALAFLALAHGTARAAEVRKVKLSITAVAATSAPYFIAIDKGYFAAEGLEVEIINAGGGVAIPALISGSVDFSMSAAVSVGASMRGAQLRVIYTMADRPAYQVWSIDPAITTLADLKGKQVGIISRGDTFEIAMRITLRDAGLPQDFVGYTALGPGTSPRQAALASGAMPAVIMSSADVLPLRGSPAFAKAHVIVDMEKAIRMPYTGIATSERLITTDRELVKHFLRGMLKGVLYMRAHKDETVAILKKAEPTGDPAEFIGDWDELIPALTADGTASDELIEKDFAVRAAILNLPPDSIPPIDRVYDYGPLREVEAEFAKSGWKPER